jgi:hypothetical protein
MKKNATIAITALLFSIASLGFAGSDTAVPPWKRGEKRARGTAVDTRPPAQLPAGLRRATATAEAGAARGSKTAITRSNGDLERRLVADARRAADERVSSFGVTNYFRVGFHQGMLDALNDDRIGRHDFRQGLRHGGTDREALRTGRQLGSDAAVDLATVDAEDIVAAQFRDLENEPVFASRRDAPAWAAPQMVFDVPGVEELFEEFPLPGFDSLGREFDLYIAGWEWDAARLYACWTHVDFYSKDWDSANLAFREWRSNPRNERLLRGLTAAEIQRLRDVFSDVFVRRIDVLADRKLMPAWNLGLDRGWDYGRFIHEELDYRTGFANGFRQQASLAAKAVFRSAYPGEFSAAYAESFELWSTTAVPAIGTVRLLDGNDDGVFEPGERVVADIELINFGGAEGRFMTALDGAALSEIDSTPARLPRRSAVVRRGLLEAVIDGSIRPRTRAQLTVRVGDGTKIVQLLINRPLEWVDSSLRLLRDNLDGRVRVELDLRNLSRRERSAEASLTTNTREDIVLSQELTLVRPADQVTVRFDVENLSALDLVGGRVSMDLFLDSDGVEQDRMTAALGETATDLSNRELPRLVRRMIAEGANAVETAQVRELLLRRLRADWRAAVHASGNPYKRDYRSGGDLTALGQLVQLSSSSSARSGRADLLEGLSSDVLTLAQDLPGPHPLLRKYVKRLARRLP